MTTAWRTLKDTFIENEHKGNTPNRKKTKQGGGENAIFPPPTKKELILHNKMHAKVWTMNKMRWALHAAVLALPRRG